MAGKVLKSRYESEVHIGLMAIIFLLLLLNVVSNYVIYQTRQAEQSDVLTHLQRAGITIARKMQELRPEPLGPELLQQLKLEQGLAELAVVPTKPPGSSTEARQKWFRAVIKQYPPDRNGSLLELLSRTDLMTLTRREDERYALLYPVASGPSGAVLIMGVDSPLLAYLDDSRQLVSYVFVASFLVVGLVYFVLSRTVFRPFRRIRETANQAGRLPVTYDNDTEAVVEEYERTIHQLTTTQQELVRLNREVTSRADSLEQFNRYLMQSERTGVVTLDQDGKAMAVNRTAQLLLGLQEEQGSGLEYSTVFAAFPELVREIQETRRGAATEGFREYSGAIDRETEQTIGVTFTEVGNSTDRGPNLLLMLADLTELQRLRTELEQRQRLAALGEMAGGLAHQMRNSLGAIGGYGVLMKRRFNKIGEATEPVEALLEEARQADTLISRFLSFARPLELDPATLDPSLLVRECIESFRNRPDAAAIEWRLNLEPELEIEGDALLLKQALANLVDNGIEACPTGGGVMEIALARTGDRITLDIRDNGEGIAPDQLEKIFTPFFSSRPSGTGLGLPLADKIVGLHHGHLTVESSDSGSCFRISLPVAVGESLTAEQSVVDASL